MKLKSKSIQVSCDGGAATGKSTGARMVARRYNLKFLSSELLYRYASFIILKKKPKNEITFLRKKFKNLNYSKLKNISLHSQKISEHSALIAKKNNVRLILKNYQKKFSKKYKNCCIEGRDISTKILPNSDVKFFFKCNLDIAAKRRFKELKKTDKKIKFKDVKKALRIRNILDISRKNSPLLKHRDSIEIDTSKLNKQAMLTKMSKHIERVIKKNMASEQELKNSTQHKEFQNLLDQDFKDRQLKENEIIKATVTEITKNFIVVDCKAKMEGMIPIEEFKNDEELSKLKVGSKIEIFLERIESFKGEIIISRDKARKMKAWKKMEKIFETKEEITAYITGKVKGGFIATVDGLPCFMPSSQIDVRPLKKFDHLMNVPIKVIATRLDKNRGNVCVSRRAVLEKSKNAGGN